ncbi:endonuclease MutS2 [Anaeromyxobacter sp. Fw109-5]|uniref:Endonuclease MutS2 n=1 Tax=Anaeromyxobacter sp. (strain Fw109-5) TaxID=404589 RepID=MUTS2_ANADF|nr:Smr/MutS family protein [Anaeromyxobacter sp. Fw109-5]A7HAB8.1 RecName: Full=Endonuclease MutS2 [Anaeromyxobacter sp. Fw109-5]ABS25664.1 Smr protein/MutS2 [Anaeromyxobacter sp. Fw109-5]
MTDRTQRELGWPEILNALAARCRLPAGRNRALALPFQPTAEAAREALALVGEARRLSELALALPLGGVGDVEGHLERASKGGVLEPLALRECAALARAAARTRGLLEARASETPRLWALAEPLSPSAALADRIERAIEPSGAISDRASAELAQARERSRGLHRALKAQVETLLADADMQRHLRDTYFTIRNERYVLPVLASARRAVPGIVHNASQSGQTLFVEPDSMVELGNELSIANAVAAEEEQRILRELTGALMADSGALARDLGILAALDVLEGSALLASDLDAHAPEVLSPFDGLRVGGAGAGFELLSLRHPLLVLQGKKVVPSHVRLDAPARALIVSGPNGGGKTVAITAVGLSALMLRAGLPVAAAEGSRLPFFLEVKAAVDERGDLAKDLSTFTAHLAAVKEMLAGAVPGSLILVDEIAADTDPREGAALAAAILESLVERGAAVLVTTHLDELKALALTDPRYANARVGFDAERLAPTYQLHLGSPGSSSAIEVAARVGLPAPLVERARAALTGHGGALGQALRALDDERARLAEERRAAESARDAARKAEERARAAEEVARRAQREAAARMGEALADELEAARAEVAELLAGLQARPTVKAATDAARQLDAWRATVAQAAKATQARADAGAEALPGGEVRPGVRVRIVSLGQEGEVVEVDGKDALVRAGPLKVRRPVADLVPLLGKAKDAAKLGRSRSEKLQAASEARPSAPPGLERRLDVRGLRVEELLREVERFLDRLYSDGEADCLILHGHGTGALKQALRDHLSASPYVGAFRAGDRHEGGDAVTVVSLRR